MLLDQLMGAERPEELKHATHMYRTVHREGSSYPHLEKAIQGNTRHGCGGGVSISGRDPPWTCKFKQFDLSRWKAPPESQYKTQAERKKAEKREKQRETKEALQRCHELSKESCRMPAKGAHDVKDMMSEAWVTETLEGTTRPTWKRATEVPRHSYA